jgi:hypothetical protein
MASPTQIGVSSFPAPTRQPGMMRFFGFLAGAGLLNALIAAFLFLRLPDSHAPTLTSLFLRAFIFVACGALAGSVGIWFYWRHSGSPFSTDPPVPLSLFVLCCAAGWVWVPAFVLLSREDSPLTAPIAILAAALLATALRKAIPPGSVLYPEEHPAPPEDHELFAATLRRPRREAYGYIVALCIYLAGYYYASGWIIDGSSMLAGSAFIFAWKLTLEPTQKPDNRKQNARAARRLAYAVLPAILVTCFALLYGVEHRNRAESDAALASTNSPSQGDDASQKPETASKDSATGISGYESIILWPVEQKKQILPPLPAQSPLLAPGTTKPLIIKFDGPYYYFQPPHKGPSPTARQAHGTPLAIDFQANNFTPLIMEAHQTLGQSIPLARCREIQLGILNSDNRPGVINIAVLLTDSSSPSKPQLYLGQQPVVSSQPGQFDAKSSPAEETLRFPIPSPAKIRKFDEITVMFFPDSANYDIGPKVAIDQFQLIPR